MGHSVLRILKEYIYVPCKIDLLANNFNAID